MDLVLGRLQLVHIQQGLDGLDVPSFGGGDGVLQHTVEGQAGQLLLDLFDLKLPAVDL